MQHLIAAACSGKQRHQTRQIAERACRSLRGRHERVTPYRCEHCGGWHVGTRTGKAKPRVQEAME